MNSTFITSGWFVRKDALVNLHQLVLGGGAAGTDYINMLHLSFKT
jgi:hypothetical protein